MPHFTLQLTQQSGPVITALFSVSAERRDALTRANQPIPKEVDIRALVDTGASCTCVDPSVIQLLQLTPTGNVPVNTPTTGNDPVDVDQYDVSLIIPGATADHSPFYLETLPVLCTDLARQGIQALIGRDVLKHCILSYNGDMEWFSLSY